MPSIVEIPEALVLRHRRTMEGRSWLKSLPGYLNGALQRWELTVDLPVGALPWYGHTGVVVPVRTGSGTAAALKVAFPYEEVLLEPLALRLWRGEGVVRLLEAHMDSCSMLIERLDAGKSLQQAPMDQAIDVWGALVKQLSVVPDERPEWAALPHIAATAEKYSDDLPARWEELGRPFERWLLEAALEVCQTRGIVSRRSSRDVLVHTDLHFMNILGRLDGSGYLAIDPQASIGDAEFAVAPCLWNRLGDLPQTSPEAALRRRCAQLSAAAGLDESVAVEWAIVREVENALWYLEKVDHAGDAQRSLWVASTMAGSTLPGLPAAHELKPLG